MTGKSHDTLVQKQFGASADHYRTSASHARGRSLARLLALVRPRADWLVLDVATGTGHTAATLAPHVAMVVAGDMTREMLQQAGIVCQERGLANVHRVQSSALALPHGERMFDLVTCRVAAHHFPDPGSFVAESARVLKPGGCLVVIDNLVPDDEATAAWINDFERRRDPSHAACLSAARWRTLYARQGLGMEHEETSAKWFDYREWMARMNVAPETIESMGAELMEAPAGVRDLWQPRRKQGRIELALCEAILVGRKQSG